MNRYSFDNLDLAGRRRTGLTVLACEPNGATATLWADEQGRIALANPLTPDASGGVRFYAVAGELTLTLSDADHHETMSLTVTPTTHRIVFTPETPRSAMGGSDAVWGQDPNPPFEGMISGLVPCPELETLYLISRPAATYLERAAACDVLRVTGGVMFYNWYTWVGRLHLLVGGVDILEIPFDQDLVQLAFEVEAIVVATGTGGRLLATGRKLIRKDAGYDNWITYKHGLHQAETVLDLSGSPSLQIGLTTETSPMSDRRAYVQTLAVELLKK